MQSLWKIYHDDVPGFIREMAQTPAMQRLMDVGMHCGCEYPRFPQYVGTRQYSRWVHSVGVALIVWHFTGDMKQAAAGLLHDIASPAFAHVVDFLHGDYIAQESTEDETEAIIRRAPELMQLLDKYKLTVEEVCDYHMYPVADNDSPQLSADRLEYTIGNALCHGLAKLDELGRIYEDLTVGTNEYGQPEIVFRTEKYAVRFAGFSLTNSKVYSSDEDRFAMQALADILRTAIDMNLITEPDLYTTEAEIVRKICSHEELNARWRQYTLYSTIIRSKSKPADGYWINVDAKRRHIDPMIADTGRVTGIDPGYKAELEQYRNESYDYWISAIE